MNKKIQKYFEKNRSELFKTLYELSQIPAPSHLEDVRAKYCKEWLDVNVKEGAYIDNAKNVIFPINSNSETFTVFAAHTDTVFPDTIPMKYFEDEERIYCAGVGDNTISVVILLYVIKFLVEKNINTSKGILFVFNSCEEGLGNLEGTKQLFNDYANKVDSFISFDSFDLNTVNDSCVGSHRYKVEVATEGGHSYMGFGNESAVRVLANIINEIYNIDIPQVEGEKTTYNVGEISGGTSVNTIPQSASMLCEYRSTSKKCLEYMQIKFEEIFSKANSCKTKVNVEKIGVRPCSDIDDKKIDNLRKIICSIIKKITGNMPTFKPSSTDCNIPLSMGIPALCVGVYNGRGAHTREEYVEKSSIPIGLEIAISFVLSLIEG